LPPVSDIEATHHKDGLWTAAVAIAKAEGGPALVPFFLDPFGDAFDRADDLMLERTRRIDGGLLSMLVVLALASAVTLGLTAPTARQRWISAMLFALLTMSLLTILDLDQATSGNIRLSDTASRHDLSGMEQSEQTLRQQ
jgi:hypothetical protein